MKFFKLLYDYENDENSILLEIDEVTLGFDRYDVEKGISSLKLSNNIGVTYDDVNGKMVTDYVANDLIWFIVTEKFKEIIQSIDDRDIQFHPLVAKSRNSEAKQGFFLVNICNIVDGLDLETSKYSIYVTDDGDKMVSIQKYAIKLNVIKEYNLFRLKDDYVSIFVSEKMKKAIEKAGITGCDFLEVKVI